MHEVLFTPCYSLAYALVWFALGCMTGYVFKPGKSRRSKHAKHK